MLVTQVLQAKVTLAVIGILVVVLGTSSCGGGSSSTSKVPPAGNPVPSLISFTPFNATAGGAGFSLTLNGSGFASNASVTWDGNALATTFVSSNQLMAQVTASDIAAAGIAQITVSNPAPGGGVSNVFRFGVNPASPSANFLYVGSGIGVLSAPDAIYGYSIDPNSGELTALTGSPSTASPYETITGPMGMDRLGKFLYVVNVPQIPFFGPPSCTSCTNFAGFSSNGSGDLAPLAPWPLSTLVPNSFVADPTGNVLYDSGGPGANQGTDIVTMLIDANSGTLTPIADSRGFDQFVAMVLNPAGTFLYGAGSSSSPVGIWVGSINTQTGYVTVVATPKTKSAVTALAVHPSGKFLFAVGYPTFPTVFSYAIDPTNGTLTLLNSIQYTEQINLTDVVVHPSGKFLYVSESGPYILGFSIDGDGNLTPAPGSPYFTGGGNTVFLATDSAGKFLYAAGGVVSGFTVDANSGALTPITGSPFLAGDGPGAIVITP